MTFSRAITFFLLLISCGPKPDEIEARLSDIAQEDLSTILGELKQKKIDTLVLENPHFKIQQLQYFSGDTAREYAAMAEVHFIYLKSLKFYQVRRYRYKTFAGKWDRYFVELKHLPDSLVLVDSILKY